MHSSHSNPSKSWLERQKPGGFYACLIWGLAAFAFGYAFFHRVAPSVMVADLMTEFAIGGAMLGTLSALYFYPYVLLQIPLGALLETIGVRVFLSAALCLAGLGSVIFSMADSLALAYLGRILIGVGSSVGFLGSLALASRWFSPSHYGFLAGLTMFTGMTSGMIAQAPLAILVENFGWRNCLLALGFLGMGLAFIVLLLVRNQPAEQILPDKEIQQKQSFHILLKRAFVSVEVWKIALVAATLSGPMLALGGLWGTPYLMQAYDLPRPQAAFLVSLLLLGWAIGAPSGGWLSDRLGKRKIILVCGAALVSLFLAILIFVPSLPLSLAVLMLVLIGMAGSLMTGCFDLVREVIPKQISGAATGIINSMTVASGAVLQPLVGWVLDLQWDGHLRDLAPVYDAQDYRLAFILILGSSILGLIAALSLKEPKNLS